MNKKVVVKAPDWFYVPQVESVPAGVIGRSYTPDMEGGAVAVVMEFLSAEEGGELSVRSTPLAFLTNLGLTSEQIAEALSLSVETLRQFVE